MLSKLQIYSLSSERKNMKVSYVKMDKSPNSRPEQITECAHQIYIEVKSLICSDACRLKIAMIFRIKVNN